MIDFEKLYKTFGDKFPDHPSEFWSTSDTGVLPADLKMYNTGNNVRAYNIFKEKYYEFVSSRVVKKEPSAIEKLNSMKQSKEIVTK